MNVMRRWSSGVVPDARPSCRLIWSPLQLGAAKITGRLQPFGRAACRWTRSGRGRRPGGRRRRARRSRSAPTRRRRAGCGPSRRGRSPVHRHAVGRRGRWPTRPGACSSSVHAARQPFDGVAPGRRGTVAGGHERQQLQAAVVARGSRPRTSLAGRASSSPGRPSCSMWAPVVSTAMRSPSRIASSTSWVTNTIGLVQLALEPQELLLQLGAHDRIDGAERLVHQQHRRIGGEGAGHADALLLAARQLRRVPVGRTRPASPTSSSSSRARVRVAASCPSRAARARWRRCRSPCGAGTARPAG